MNRSTQQLDYDLFADDIEIVIKFLYSEYDSEKRIR